MNEWNVWESSLHEEPQQIRKQEKAVSSDCKPIEIMEYTGTFPSSRTGKIYETTLDSCTCMSFSRDHSPCKHMYRLAFELGIMPAPSPLSYAYAKPEALGLYDTVSEDAAKLFIYHFDFPYGKYFKIENTSALQELIKVGFVEVCADKDIISDIQLASLKKDVLFALCANSSDCPKKSSNKQILVDFVKAHEELLEKLGEPPLCVCASRNIGNLYNTIKAAYHRKYPSENTSTYWN